MKAVEIDFVVRDSLAALSLYENIFEIERIEVTDLELGTNEVVFKIFNTQFHMLDANPEYNLVAPRDDQATNVWFNVTVPDIAETYEKAMNAGCTIVQEVTKLEDYGVSNAMFRDPFGYVWMLHEVHKVVSHEERIRVWEESQEE